jgi:osmotically-inducible protein OsmY
LQTDVLHGDVIAGIATYDELDHELVGQELSGYRVVHRQGPRLTGDDDFGWSADDQVLEEEHMERLRHVIIRPDADIRKDVQRTLVLDCLVPMTVHVQVSDGIVTLTGTVGTDRERECAKYLAGLVPGVFGVMDELACRALPGAEHADADAEADDDAVRDAVVAALRRTDRADLADLNVESPCNGTVIVFGAVSSGGDRDLAIATARSVAEVESVDDCIDVAA